MQTARTDIVFRNGLPERKDAGIRRIMVLSGPQRFDCGIHHMRRRIEIWFADGKTDDIFHAVGQIEHFPDRGRLYNFRYI